MRSKLVSLAAAVVVAFATLVCVDAQPAPPRLPRDLNEWTVEYSIVGGRWPRRHSVSLTSAGGLVGTDTDAGHHVTARVSDDVVAKATSLLKRAQPAKPDPPSPDKPRLGLVLDTGGRTYDLEPTSDITKILDEAFDGAVAAGVIGEWRQSGWKLCKPVPQVNLEKIDPPIDPLIFKSDGTFSVTWLERPTITEAPHVQGADYTGHYTLNPSPSQGYIQMSIDGGRFVPVDFSGRGGFGLADGALTIRNAWFGTKRVKPKPNICELTFAKK